jgi:hypothetical protein
MKSQLMTTTTELQKNAWKMKDYYKICSNVATINHQSFASTMQQYFTKTLDSGAK